MSHRTALITGASGFIGGELARALQDANFRTIGVSREGRNLPYFNSVVTGRLGEPLEGVFNSEKIDVVVHCALAVGKNDYELNVNGTKMWAEQALAAGVELQIFLSSVSVLGENASAYGQAKAAMEPWFEEHGGIVLRLGLVVGRGGLFGRMVRLIKSFPVIPLIDSGRTKSRVIGISSVCNAVLRILVNSPRYQGKTFDLQQQDSVTMSELLREIRLHTKNFCLFLPIPWFPIFVLAKTLEFVHLNPFGISSTSLKGLKCNDSVPFRSDLDQFGISDVPLSELVQEALT